MKRFCIIIGIVLLLAICLFPFDKQAYFSGRADVLNAEKEKLGECELSVEIKETRSLFFSYVKAFYFSIDGKEYSPYEFAPPAKADGLSLLTQYYYDEAEDRIAFYSLIYPQDMTYFVLRMDEKLYYLDKGAGLSYSDLPVS